MKRLCALAAVFAVAILANQGFGVSAGPAAAAGGKKFLAPARFYPQALCVHDGWHYRRAWSRHDKHRAQYRFGAAWFIRTWKTWSNGEGAWNVVDPPYGGGMQFLLSTWHRAGGAGSSVSAIARASPRQQIYRAWRIVRSDGGSWREWPNTSRACGLA